MIDGSEKRKRQLLNFRVRVFWKSAVTPCHVSTACQRKESLLSKGILFFDVIVSRLRVVPHLSSGIVERAKREHA